jgi:hypothetical protein
MGQEGGKDLGRPSFALTLSEPPDEVGHACQWLFHVTKTVRAGSR